MLRRALLIAAAIAIGTPAAAAGDATPASVAEVFESICRPATEHSRTVAEIAGRLKLVEAAPPAQRPGISDISRTWTLPALGDAFLVSSNPVPLTEAPYSCAIISPSPVTGLAQELDRRLTSAKYVQDLERTTTSRGLRTHVWQFKDGTGEDPPVVWVSLWESGPPNRDAGFILMAWRIDVRNGQPLGTDLSGPWERTTRIEPRKSGHAFVEAVLGWCARKVGGRAFAETEMDPYGPGWSSISGADTTGGLQLFRPRMQDGTGVVVDLAPESATCFVQADFPGAQTRWQPT